MRHTGLTRPACSVPSCPGLVSLGPRGRNYRAARQNEPRGPFTALKRAEVGGLDRCVTLVSPDARLEAALTRRGPGARRTGASPLW